MHQNNISLSHRLELLLHSHAGNDTALIDSINVLAAIHGNDVYDEFFHVMTFKRFGVDSAALHWENIYNIVNTAQHSSHRRKEFLPTILHYLLYDAKAMNNPRFLEADCINNIQRSSVSDGLTGLFNQTFFKISLEKMVQQAIRKSVPPFAVVLFDLDHFKLYNDSCGHLAGDKVLRRVAEIIRENLRESDIASRYGGEEFALLLPQATQDSALNVAQRIRKSIENEVFTGQELLPTGNLTISGGVSEFSSEAQDPERIINLADAELYKAKGRRNSIYPANEDRRSSFRRPIKSLVEFSPISGNSFKSCISIDISKYGIAFGCDTSLEIESTIDLRFNRPFWSGDCHLCGTVRQSRRSGELNFIGVEFEKVLTGPNDSSQSSFDLTLY